MSALALENVLKQLAELIADRVVDRVGVKLATRPAQPAAELVTMAEFARQRSISVGTVRNMIRDGRLEATKIGRRAVRVRADAQIGKPARRQPDAQAARVQRIKIGGAR